MCVSLCIRWQHFHRIQTVIWYADWWWIPIMHVECWSILMVPHHVMNVFSRLQLQWILTTTKHVFKHMKEVSLQFRWWRKSLQWKKVVNSMKWKNERIEKEKKCNNLQLATVEGWAGKAPGSKKPWCQMPSSEKKSIFSNGNWGQDVDPTARSAYLLDRIWRRSGNNTCLVHVPRVTCHVPH